MIFLIVWSFSISSLKPAFSSMSWKSGLRAFAHFFQLILAPMGRGSGVGGRGPEVGGRGTEVGGRGSGVGGWGRGRGQRSGVGDRIGSGRVGSGRVGVGLGLGLGLGLGVGLRSESGLGSWLRSIYIKHICTRRQCITS